MADGYTPRRRIDRTAKPNPDPGHRKTLHQSACRALDLLQDAHRAAFGVDVQPLPSHQLGTFAVANAQLQFRAADFDTQKHVDASPRNSNVHEGKANRMESWKRNDE